MTILEFAEAVRAAAGGGGQIVFKPLPRDDPKQRQPDITRAQELLGWEPKAALTRVWGDHRVLPEGRRPDGRRGADHGVRQA